MNEMDLMFLLMNLRRVMLTLMVLTVMRVSDTKNARANEKVFTRSMEKHAYNRPVECLVE